MCVEMSIRIPVDDAVQDSTELRRRQQTASAVIEDIGLVSQERVVCNRAGV